MLYTMLTGLPDKQCYIPHPRNSESLQSVTLLNKQDNASCSWLIGMYRLGTITPYFTNRIRLTPRLEASLYKVNQR